VDLRRGVHGPEVGRAEAAADRGEIAVAAVPGRPTNLALTSTAGDLRSRPSGTTCPHRARRHRQPPACRCYHARYAYPLDHRSPGDRAADDLSRVRRRRDAPARELPARLHPQGEPQGVLLRASAPHELPTGPNAPGELRVGVLRAASSAAVPARSVLDVQVAHRHVVPGRLAVQRRDDLLRRLPVRRVIALRASRQGGTWPGV